MIQFKENLPTENHTVLASDPNCSAALLDCLLGVLHLEEVAIRGEHSDGVVVSGHDLLLWSEVW